MIDQESIEMTELPMAIKCYKKTNNIWRNDQHHLSMLLEKSRLLMILLVICGDGDHMTKILIRIIAI